MDIFHRWASSTSCTHVHGPQKSCHCLRIAMNFLQVRNDPRLWGHCYHLVFKVGVSNPEELIHNGFLNLAMIIILILELPLPHHGIVLVSLLHAIQISKYLKKTTSLAYIYLPLKISSCKLLQESGLKTLPNGYRKPLHGFKSNAFTNVIVLNCGICSIL